MIVFIWSCSSILSVSLAWGSFGTCMGSAVTALNHYTKTIIEFKFKRRTIEKKILELDVPEDLWYITSLQEQADQHAALYVNGSEPNLLQSHNTGQLGQRILLNIHEGHCSSSTQTFVCIYIIGLTSTEHDMDLTSSAASALTRLKLLWTLFICW